jgi:hypothetical protein
MKTQTLLDKFKFEIRQVQGSPHSDPAPEGHAITEIQPRSGGQMSGNRPAKADALMKVAISSIKEPAA